MAVKWQSGFDEIPSAAGIATGTAGSRQVDSAATPVITTSSPKHGAQAISMAGTAATRNITLTSATLGTTTTKVGSGWIRYPSLPGAGLDTVCPGVNQPQQPFIYFHSGTGKLAASWSGGSGNEVFSPNVMVAGQWVHVDFAIDMRAATNVMKIRVDGVDLTDAVLAQAIGTASSIALGRDSNATGTSDYDSWLLSDDIADYPLGAHKVVLLKADTAGTAVEIGTANALCRYTSNGAGLDTTFNSANILAALAEAPFTFDASSSGVYQRTAGSGNYVRIPLETYTLGAGESITSVRIVVSGWAGSATGNNLAIRVFDGTNTDIVFAVADPNFDNSTSVPVYWCAMYTPSGGWTQAKLDALCIDLGGSTDVAPNPGARAVYATVAVKLGTGALSDDVEAGRASAGSVKVTSAIAKADNVEAGRVNVGSVAVSSAKSLLANVESGHASASVVTIGSSIALSSSVEAATAWFDVAHVTSASDASTAVRAALATAATADVASAAANQGDVRAGNAWGLPAYVQSEIVTIGSLSDEVEASTASAGRTSVTSVLVQATSVDAPSVGASSTPVRSVIDRASTVEAAVAWFGSSPVVTTIQGGTQHDSVFAGLAWASPCRVSSIIDPAGADRSVDLAGRVNSADIGGETSLVDVGPVLRRIDIWPRQRQ